MERIPFEEAITEELLLRDAFATLSTPQKMILKSMYGLELTDEELRFWNAFNGCGVYDELGYLIDVKGEFPYMPIGESEETTLIVGRRSGKSERISSFALSYEALFGGHRETLSNKNQDPIFLQVAQDLTTAKANLRQFIVHWLESSPVGSKELAKANRTADTIRLPTGVITVGPPTIKLRSQAIAFCAMDELAVWQKDLAGANPDSEVEIAVRPAMAQFPYRKMVKTSTPWTEEGLLWTAYQKGTYAYKLPHGLEQATNAKTLVFQAPTAAMGNPLVPKEYLVQERARDANAFLREYLAQFAKSVSGFLSTHLLRSAVTPRVGQRDPKAGMRYIATMDPAFRQDAFAFCIGHLENGVFWLDFLDAPRGTKELPLSPSVRMATIAQVCRHYGVDLVTTDQFHDTTLQELAMRYDLSVEPFPLTAEKKVQVWSTFLSLLNMQKLRLLDDPLLLEELMGMERELTSANNVKIYGKRDDRAGVVALCVHKAMQFGEAHVPQVKKIVPMSTQIRQNVMKGGKPSSAWWNG